MMASLGVYFIAFASDNRLVTLSDAIRVWDLSTGRELRTIERDLSSLSGFNGTESGTALSADGTQLLLLTDDSEPEVRFVDLASGREVRRVKVPVDQVDSLQLSFNADGHLLALARQVLSAADTDTARELLHPMVTAAPKGMQLWTRQYLAGDGHLLAGAAGRARR